MVAATFGADCKPNDLCTASAALRVASMFAVANDMPDIWIHTWSDNFAFHMPVRYGVQQHSASVGCLGHIMSISCLAKCVGLDVITKLFAFL